MQVRKSLSTQMVALNSRQSSKSWKRFNRHIKGFLFVLPALTIYGFFILYSGVQSLFFSFFSWQNISTRAFAGLKNYYALPTDRVFLTALSHNLIWAFLTVALLIVFLMIAVFLTKVKGRLIFSAIYFLPATIPFVVSAIMWGWIYNPVFGVLNFSLKSIGLDSLTRPWLANTNIALYALFVIGTWTYFGFCIVIFMSALQGIDTSLYEAAKIDGASDVQTFFHITIPSIKNTIIFLSIYSIIGAMKFFDIVYVMTQGGPGYSTEILSTYIFKLAFREQRIGYATSISMVQLILVVGLSILILRRGRER